MDELRKIETNTYAESIRADPTRRPAYVEGSLIADAHALLVEAFEDSGLSYRDISERLGVSRARAHAVLTGDGNLTLGMMARVAAAMGLMWRVALEDIQSGAVCHSFPPIGRSGTPGSNWVVLPAGDASIECAEPCEVHLSVSA
jgi:hypothetical protein